MNTKIVLSGRGHSELTETGKTMVMRTIIELVMVCGVFMAALLGLPSLSGANGGDPIWTFQDAQPGIQEAQASAVDSVGNLIITGYTNNGADDDFYTIKVSADGQNVLWASYYNMADGDDWAVKVVVDSNDDVIVTGFAFNGVNNDIVTIKYDGTLGHEVWAQPHILNGVVNGNDYPLSLAVDHLNDIYVAGYSQTGGSTGDDAVLFKLSPNVPNPDGTPIWLVNYNGVASGDDRFNDVAAGPSGVVVTGHSTVDQADSRRDFDYLTQKFDQNGNFIWSAVYDNGTANDFAYYVALDSQGDVLVTGEVISVSRHDIHTIKYSAAGDGSGNGVEIWTTDYSGGSPNVPQGLVVDTDDDVFLTGYSFTSSGKDDFYTARYKGLDGALLWDDIHDSGANNSDVAQALAVDDAGGLFVTGYTHKDLTSDDDFLTLKYNKDDGNLLWEQLYDGPAGGDEQPVGVAVAIGIAADGNVYVAGWSDQITLGVSDYDYYAIKYDAGLLNPPTGLVATVVSETNVDMVWDDNSSGAANEDYFCIDRCQGFNCNDFAELDCSIGQDVNSYTDLTVVADQWYSYQVRAVSIVYASSYPSAESVILTTVIDYPAPDWLYSFDGEGLDDVANAIRVGFDNNPVATGMSASANSQYDYYTVKLDRAVTGSVVWSDTYDGPDGQGDMAVCLAVDNNDEVLVSGFSSMNAGQGFNTNDIFTIKYAADGPDQYTGYPLWTAQYNGPGNDDDRSEAVSSISDGSNYSVVVGYGKNVAGNDDIYLIKYKPDYDAAGQQEWSIIPFDRGFNDYPADVSFDPSGDVIVVGRTYNAVGDSDIFISKYSGVDGSLMSGWPYIYDSGNGNDGLNAVTVGDDGSIYVAGYLAGPGGDLDFYVNKFSASGSAAWGSSGKNYDGGLSSYDEALAIVIDPNDREITVSGTMTTPSGGSDFSLRRFTEAGSERWNVILERAENEEMVGMAMSPSGELCLVGNTDNNVDVNVIAVKYDHLGDLIGSTMFDNGFDDYSTSVTVNRLGEFYIAGYSTTGNLATDDYDFVVFRFNGDSLQAPSPFSGTGHHTTVDLVWTQNDPSVEGYKLFRKTGSCSVGSTVFSPDDFFYQAAAGDTNHTDSGLNIGSTYCYGIQSVQPSSGAMSRVLEHQVTTSVPVGPDALTASVLNSTDVEVCWQDNTATEDGFAVQRCVGIDCDFSVYTTLFAPAETDSGAASTCMVDTSACDSGAGKTFSYRVQAYKVNAWNTGYSSVASNLTTPALAPPVALAAVRVTEAIVDLQWTDNSNDETEFVIERCLDSGCVNFAEVGTVAAVKNNLMFWQMDEASWSGAADEVADASGNGNNGTAFGNATTVAQGYKNSGASFDGIDDYLGSPVTVDQSVTSAGVTFMAWVSPASVSSGDHYLFSTEDGAAGSEKHSWGLMRSGNIWYVDSGELNRSTGVVVDENSWQHVIVVFKPGTGVFFYKNGVETYVNYIGYHDLSATLTLGRQGVLAQNFFDGLVDEVAVFDRALNASEVSELFSRGVFPEVSGLKWYSDTSGLVYDTTYKYQVRSRKSGSCGLDLSLPTNSVEVTTVPPAPSQVSAVLADPGRVVLSWQPGTTTQTGFQVERCSGAGCSTFAIIDNAIAADGKFYWDTSLCYGSDGVNRYLVKALGAWGESAASEIVEAIISPGSAPLSLAVDHASEGTVQLSWSSDDGLRDGFTILRCDGDQVTCDQSDTNFVEIAQVPMLGSDSGLQALWRMDDSTWSGVPGEVVDSSGLSRHATSNGAVLNVPGKVGYGSAYFDGVDDYIQTDLLIDQSSGTKGMTFSAWVYPEKYTSSYQYLMSTNNGGNDWTVMTYYSNWYLLTGETSAYVGSVQFDQWQYITVAFDPARGIDFYINGVFSRTVPMLYFEDSTSPLVLGRHGSTSNYFFGGMLDEVAVYERVLSAGEIANLYSSVQVISYIDSAVSAGQNYTYRVRSANATSCADWNDNAAYAEIATTTSAVPGAPSALIGNAINSTEINLSWSLHTTTETAVILERCIGAACDFSVNDAVTLPPGSSTYSDTSVCEGITYQYRVKALRDIAPLWESVSSAPMTVSTNAANATPLTLNAISESEVETSWTDNNIDEDSYELARCLYQAGTVNCDQDAEFTLVQSEIGTMDAPLLYYHMDESSWAGTVDEVVDSSGNGNHATSYGTSIDTVAEGRYDRAGAFGAGYVKSSVVVDQSVNGAGATFEAWTYPTLSNNYERHVISTENGAIDWGISHVNSTWYVRTGKSAYNTGVPVDLNQWQHVAAVFIPGQGVNFYKNGVETFIPEIDYDLSSNVVNIGALANNTSAYYYYWGKIDEVLVYDWPLSAPQIARHVQAQESNYFTYTDSGLAVSSTYYYRLRTLKGAGCNWAKDTIVTVDTPAPPPPSALTTSADSTSCTLNWNDNNGSETAYKVSRCNGTLGDCAVQTIYTLPSDSESYVDTAVCPTQTYTYRVWAEGAWGQTSYGEVTQTTADIPAMAANLSSTLISEVEILLAWDYTAADEDGLKLERCLGANCQEILLGPGSTSYDDNELAANTDYCYRVAAYKSASCNGGWQTPWTPQSCTATTLDPGAIIPVPEDTTTVKLSWNDSYQTETATKVERCDGDLAACCGADPTDCSGSFSTVGSVVSDQSTLTDSSACAAATYTYRATAGGTSLGSGGNGCWTNRAPVNISSFAAFTGVEVMVAYQGEMQSDFSDIRFYDAAGSRELQYWIREKIDSVSATVWLMTGANDAIYLYYGNSAATDQGNGSEPFTVLYDDFAGSAIDSSKWVVFDPKSKVSQDNGLSITSSGAWDVAVISTALFGRAAGVELIYDLTIGFDTVDKSEALMLGWEKDQTMMPEYSNGAHLLYLASYIGHYMQYVYENGSGQTFTKTLYDDQTRYQIKIVLRDEMGADYYIKGGLYLDWHLLKSTNYAFAGDDVLRLGIHQLSHELMVNSVTVTFVGAGIGASVDFASSEGDGVACLGLNVWSGVATTAASTTTPDALSPASLSAQLVAGEVNLSWTANTTDENGFTIERDCGAGFVEAGSSSAGVFSFNDSNYIDSVNCTYQVSAFKNSVCPWLSPASNQVTLLAPPAAPVVTATVENAMLIRLDWSDAVDEDGYQIEVQVWNGAFMPVATVEANVNTYTDSHGVNPASQYTYRVRALRGEGSSAYGTASASTPAFVEGDSTCPPGQ